MMKIIDGGVTAAEGFQAAGLAAGIKKRKYKRYGAGIQRETVCGSRNFHD